MESFVLSYLIAELPYVLLVTAFMVNLLYWISGYSHDADRFFMFWLFFQRKPLCCCTPTLHPPSLTAA